MDLNYYKRYCSEIENVENYQKAKKDNFKGWHCHHRLETHTPEGKRRGEDIGYKELQALGMYYNRPADELIFLTSREHKAFNKGKKRSEEARRRMREAKKGKHLSEETKKKIGETKKGNTYAKGNTNTKGTHWFNNGKINIMSKECPPGFVPGMLK